MAAASSSSSSSSLSSICESIVAAATRCESKASVGVEESPTLLVAARELQSSVRKAEKRLKEEINKEEEEGEYLPHTSSTEEWKMLLGQEDLDLKTEFDTLKRQIHETQNSIQSSCLTDVLHSVEKTADIPECDNECILEDELISKKEQQRDLISTKEVIIRDINLLKLKNEEADVDISQRRDNLDKSISACRIFSDRLSSAYASLGITEEDREDEELQRLNRVRRDRQALSCLSQLDVSQTFDEKEGNERKLMSTSYSFNGVDENVTITIRYSYDKDELNVDVTPEDPKLLEILQRELQRKEGDVDVSEEWIVKQVWTLYSQRPKTS